MTTAQVVETSVSHQQSFSELHSPDHTRQTTDTPGFKPFTMQFYENLPNICKSNANKTDRQKD